MATELEIYSAAIDELHERAARAYQATGQRKALLLNLIVMTQAGPYRFLAMPQEVADRLMKDDPIANQLRELLELFQVVP